MTSRFTLLAVDVALTISATAFAVTMRENFDVSQAQPWSYLPFMCATAFSALALFAIAGLHRTVWRFSGFYDYVKVAATAVATSLAAIGLTFAYNRLEGVPRSLPFMQVLAAVAFLTSARAIHTLFHRARRRRRLAAALLAMPQAPPALTILLVGGSFLVEAFLQVARELFPGTVRVAGLLGRSERDVGRFIAAHPVLGLPEDVEQVLDMLELHGQFIDRIVVGLPFSNFSSEARAALLRAERERGVRLQLLAEDLGFEPRRLTSPVSCASAEPEAATALSFEIAPGELRALASRRFWRAKRALDAAAALALLAVSAPIMVVASVAVAVSLGFPVFFWQERPGLGGVPFRLYKLRSMRPQRGRDGRYLSDSERTCVVGNLLRRLRVDELPQLFNILRGDMSFVGPRPLLPRDQPAAFRTRLLVRPGLTGWAQIIGGRTIGPEDKAALDVWYVQNASLALDLEIMVRTFPVVLFGEKVSKASIDRAWKELRELGILKTDALQSEVAASLPSAGRL